MSQWDKLVDEILNEKPTLRFDDLCKALEKMGYVMKQPHGGSSHYTFRKDNFTPITLPKHKHMNIAYIKLVSEVVREQLKDGEFNE